MTPERKNTRSLQQQKILSTPEAYFNDRNIECEDASKSKCPNVGLFPF